MLLTSDVFPGDRLLETSLLCVRDVNDGPFVVLSGTTRRVTCMGRAHHYVCVAAVV
jgi:hypothetical protein